MKKIDLFGGLIWLVLGISLSVGSIKLKLGNLNMPGPGFMPFLSGALLGLSGSSLMLFSFLEILKANEKFNHKMTLRKENWKKFFCVLLSLFGYGLLLEYLGFFITTFIFLLFLFKISEPKKKWKIPLLLSGVIVILSYLLFSYWLKVPLPRGFFGF